MSSVPPTPFEHPGSPPPRPEVPEGIIPAPLPEPPPASRVRDHAHSGFQPWAPFAAMLAALVVALLGFAVITVLAEAAGVSVDSKDPPPGVTLGGTLLQDAALIVAAILFARSGGVRPSAWAFGLRRTRFWRAVGWAALAAVAFYVLSFVWAVALGIDENDDLAEQLGAKDSTINLIAVALLVMVVAPLTEEFFFRGFCFPALSNWLGWIGGAVATGLIFGLIHAGGTKAVFLVPLAIFGFLLCVLYRITGSILPGIGLHALNNAVALGVTLEWEAWQVLLGVVGAPAVVLAIALPLSKAVPPRPPQPAYAAP